MTRPAEAPHIALERGTADDLDSVMEVMEAGFGTQFGEAWSRSQCSGILPMAGIKLTLACDRANVEIVGFSLVRTIADESELLLLAVAPDHRRKGTGSLLLEDFMERARACGAYKVHLEVRDGNGAAAMYRKAGFAQVGRRRNYYLGADGNRHDALTFARSLEGDN